MFILRHPNTTTDHGAPPNWNPETDGPCETLPTISVNLDGRIVHASFWQPEPHELEQLNRGASIELHILQPVHPVVSLRVNAWPGERRDETGALITVDDSERVAAALEACDWSGVSIGNKEILKAAVRALRGQKTATTDNEMLILARRTAKAGRTRSDFAQLAEWAYDQATLEGDAP